MVLRATGTLEWVSELASGNPTDIDTLHLLASQVATAISVLANEFNEALKDERDPTRQKELEEQLLTRFEPLNRELERLLEIKRRLQAQTL